MSSPCEDTGKAVHALHDTLETMCPKIDEMLRLERKSLRILEGRPWLRLACGFVINANGEFKLSDSNTITLTNAANPSVATRYLAVVDLENGTSVLPTASTSNGTLLASVVGTLTGTQVAVGFYPLDTGAETNDSVTGTISLAGNPDIVKTFVISGTPVAPPETDTLDPSSSVGSWAGAPTVPSSPI